MKRGTLEHARARSSTLEHARARSSTLEYPTEQPPTTCKFFAFSESTACSSWSVEFAVRSGETKNCANMSVAAARCDTWQSEKRTTRKAHEHVHARTHANIHPLTHTHTHTHARTHTPCNTQQEGRHASGFAEQAATC
jgi:hypothetical protein